MRAWTSSLGTRAEIGLSGPDASNSNQPSHGGQSALSIGGLVGIVAGVIGAIATVIGCFLKYKQYQKRKLQATQANLEK